MATIRVCDGCGERDGVLNQSALELDLCHPCAMMVIGECVTSYQYMDLVKSGFLSRVLNEKTVASAEKVEASPAGVTVLSDEVKDKQRRAALAIEHGTEVYYVKLALEDETLPQVARYGGQDIVVLEKCQSANWTHFAKLA